MLNWERLVREAVAVRKRERLSQRDLAALAGITQPTVVKFEKRSTSSRTSRSQFSIGLYLRCHLSRARRRRGPRPAPLQHPGHAMASRRNLAPGDTRRPRRRPPRPGRMAYHRQAHDPAQHHASALAAKGARTEPRGEHMAVHARQLAVQSRFQIIRRYPHPLLRRMEQPHRSAVAHHVHRAAAMGP